MTPLQLSRTLKSAGLSQRGAARILGINERTMRKYVAGESVIPTAIKYALFWIAHCGDDADLRVSGRP